MSDTGGYHINPETGRPNLCRAKIKCRFKDQTHYETKAEAKKAAESDLSEEFKAHILKSRGEAKAKREKAKAEKLEAARLRGKRIREEKRKKAEEEENSWNATIAFAKYLEEEEERRLEEEERERERELHREMRRKRETQRQDDFFDY